MTSQFGCLELLITRTFLSGPVKFEITRVDCISTLVGHFVSSPREREKRDRRGDEREGQGNKRNRNDSEETEETKHFLSTLTCYKDSRHCPSVSQYQLDALVT